MCTQLKSLCSSHCASLCDTIRIMASPNTTSSKVSAEQPESGKYLPLSELNEASARTGGSWVVDAFHPVEHNLEYTWQSPWEDGTSLVVTLVSEKDASQYCQGRLWKDVRNEAKYERKKKAMMHGVRYIMSNVCFIDEAKLAYVSCPLKVVVDLTVTKMDTVLYPNFHTVPHSDFRNSVLQPAPTATIADSAGLAGNQCFDVTALIQEVQDIRRHAHNRSSLVVKIYDGSVDPDTKKVKLMPVRIDFDTARPEISICTNSAGQPVSGEGIRTLAEAHLQSKTPMSFFCISAAQDDTGTFLFRSTKHTFITAAVGTKADRMKEATELHNLLAVSRSWNRAAGLVLQRCLLS